MKNLRIAKGAIVISDINIEEVIRGISAVRLRKGGAPMFVAMIKNHMVDIVGANIRIPLLIMSVRELVIS